MTEAGLLCPQCHSADSAVYDSRNVVYAQAKRRRRECLACGRRWSTVEVSVPDDMDNFKMPIFLSVVELRQLAHRLLDVAQSLSLPESGRAAETIQELLEREEVATAESA